MTKKKLRRALARQLRDTGLSLPVRSLLAKRMVQVGGIHAGLPHLAWIDDDAFPGVVVVRDYRPCACGCCDGSFHVRAVTGPRGSVVIK